MIKTGTRLATEERISWPLVPVFSFAKIITTRGYMKKICNKCGELKSIVEYSHDKLRKDGYSDICKKCHSKYASINRNHLTKLANRTAFFRRKIYKDELVNILGGKCLNCGYDKCSSAMDFHHKDPSVKEFKISDRYCFSVKEKNKVIEEVKKCMLLCSNCHRELHYRLTEEKYKKKTPTLWDV